MRGISIKIRRFAIVTAVVLPFSWHGQHVADSSSAATPPARRISVDGIPKSAEVTPNLYRGGVPSKPAFQTLASMGINIVVDLRGSREGERKEATGLGMHYVPLPGHCPFPRDTIFARFLTILRENSGKKVFVHCRLGDDRAGMMIAVYRMAEQGWTSKQAMKEMEAHGFSFAYRFICPGLATYESHFQHRLKSSPAFESLRAQQKLSTDR